MNNLQINTDRGWKEVIIDGNCDFYKFERAVKFLQKDLGIHFNQKLQDLESAYWDFKFKKSALTLHYNIYLGLSLFPTKLDAASPMENQCVLDLGRILSFHFMEIDYDEKILWVGKPEFKPYIIGSFLKEGAALLLFAIFVGFTFILSLLNKSEYGWNLILTFASIIIIISIYKILSKIIGYRKTKYVISDQMVLIKKGLLNNIMTIGKDEIKFVDIKSTKIERKYNVGTIMLYTEEIVKSEDVENRKYYSLDSVKNPEDIIKLF